MPGEIIKDMLPSRWRKVVYAAYAIAGVVIGAIQVGFAAAELTTPVWLIVTLAVYAFIGGAVGLTATSHTPGKEVVRDEDDYDYEDYTE